MACALVPGALVELAGRSDGLNGALGQIKEITDGKKFVVSLINGSEETLGPAGVKVPEGLKRPGLGGEPNSFDILMGPVTPQEAFAEEMSACLFEKGFCVVKVCQSMEDVSKAVASMKENAQVGKLQRLPEEVEEGYIGANNKGNVMWLDPSEIATTDPLIVKNDNFLSTIASLIQPYCSDILGKHVDERTPGLVTLSLTDDEEPEFPPLDADDGILGNFLTTYRRSLIKVVHFMGPEAAEVTLEQRDDTEAMKTVPNKLDAVDISADANTIVVFRTDLFSYACKSDEAVLSLSTTLLENQGVFELTSWEGDDQFIMGGEGPPGPRGEPIHVVNTATRIMANWDEPEGYKAGLIGGCDTGMEIPLTRWNVHDYWDGDTDNLQPWQCPTRHQSVVEGVDLFDNKYFEIAATEVRMMDPMQRMVLECGAKNLFKMGITKKVSNRNPHHGGCSVGLDKDDWDLVIGKPEGGTNVQAIISNRFSFIFNLRGPNYVADTACSASMCATHLAKFTLMDRSIDKIAFHIGIGLHLCLVPRYFAGGKGNTMNSPIGRCLTFNATASGYMRGDGCCGLTLKSGAPFDEQEAVWRASMCGQNGRSATLTAPNGLAQGDIIDKAMKEAKITPIESCIWSCHGTGTSLGDPIEVGAIRRIQIKEQRVFSLPILTNKTHCGHLEGGAAMTSLIAAVQAISVGATIPCCHLNVLNPNLEQSAFDAFYNSEPGCVRTVADRFNQVNVHISSFGFGGTNGHVIMWGQSFADAPDVPRAIKRRLHRMSPPEVRVNGSDPAQWEWDGPDAGTNFKEKYCINLTSQDAKDAAVTWVKETDGQEEGDDEDDFYCITGPFNEWDADRMEDGDVTGMRIFTLEIPESGEVEFRFLKNGEEDEILYPPVDKCSRRNVPILGPAKEDKGKEKNTWMVEGVPGTELKISLFVCQGLKSLVWSVV